MLREITYRKVGNRPLQEQSIDCTLRDICCSVNSMPKPQRTVHGVPERAVHSVSERTVHS